MMAANTSDTMDPMLSQLLAAIQSIRPNLDFKTRVLLEAMLLMEGPLGSAEVVSRDLGLRNRFELSRLLQREGVPSLHRLSAWVLLLSWVQRAERDGTSLCHLAVQSHRHPSACYRLVKEITGLRWAQVRGRGSEWVSGQLMEAFHEARTELRRRADRSRSRLGSVPKMIRWKSRWPWRHQTNETR